MLVNLFEYVVRKMNGNEKKKDINKEKINI